MITRIMKDYTKNDYKDYNGLHEFIHRKVLLQRRTFCESNPKSLAHFLNCLSVNVLINFLTCQIVELANYFILSSSPCSSSHLHPIAL